MKQPDNSFHRDFLRVVLFALAYFCAQELALLFPDAQKVLAAIWPPGGIGLAALLLSRRRVWPAILGALFVAGNLANFLAGRTLAASVGFMTANLVESSLCAWVIFWCCGTEVRFNRIKEVGALIVCATAVNAITSMLGAGVAILTSPVKFWPAWSTWWVSDGLGILLITPMVLSWWHLHEHLRSIRWHRILEAGLFVAVWCAAGYLAFEPHQGFHPLLPQTYMLVGLLAWPAMRFGQRGVTVSLLILAAIGVTSGAVDSGPLPWGGMSVTERLLAFQVCLGFTGATGMLLAATYAESKWAERIARQSNAQLRAVGDNLPNGVVYRVIRDPNGELRFLHVSGGIHKLTGLSVDDVLRDASILYDLILEEDRPHLQAAQQAALRDFKVLDTTVRLRHVNGEIRWMHLCSKPHLLASGATIWDGIQTDVTERKREQAEREASEARFRLVVENAELPVVIVSRENASILFINDCAARYFEVPIRNGAPDPSGVALHENVLKLLSSDDRIVGHELEIKRLADQARWARVSANPIDFGGKQASFIVFSDITRIKEAAAQLERERTLLRTLVETVPDMIWMKDGDGRFLACNSATARFIRRDESSTVGKTDCECFPREEAERHRARDRAAVAANGPAVDQEWVTLGPESRRVLIETTTVPMIDATGRLLGVVGVGRDITANYEAQAALRERVALQEKLEKIAEASPGALFMLRVHPDGTAQVEYSSPAMDSIIGECVAKYNGGFLALMHKLLHPEDLSRVIIAGQEAQRGTSLFHKEFRVLHPKFGVRWVEQRAMPVKQSNGDTIFYGFVMDISARKLAEAVLAEEIIRRRILFEQSTDGIVLLDLQGKAQESNSAFAAMLGYDLDQTKGLTVQDWDDQWTPKELQQRLEEAYHHPITFETRQRRRDGSTCEVEINASGVELGGRKLVYCMQRDITHRKALEAAAQEKRKLEAIGILSGGMAHEFNNLLTVVNGYSDLLSFRLDAGDPAREMVDAIQDAGQKAATLTRQLLAFGRKQMMRPRLVDLNTVIETARRMWMSLLREDIQLDVEGSTPAIASVDPDQIAEALLNLVTNSVEAMPGGGKVAIRASKVNLSQAEVREHGDYAAGSFIELSVADTGTGMDEDTKVHAFEPFFTTKGRANRTGLGLSTVHGIVAQHQGWITVESSVGKGSVFNMYFPAHEDISASTKNNQKPVGKDGKARILVVDDEETVRRLTIAVLKAEGYETLQAANGIDALAVLEQQTESVELVITDVTKPGTHGRELLERIQAHEPDIKFLYLSGYGENGLAGIGSDNSSNMFLQKPFSPVALIERIREILS